MRVFLSTDTVGGVWDYTVTLARGLREAGHEVRVAVLGEPGADRLAALPAGVEVVSRAYRLEWMPGAEADVAAAGEWLAADARGWGADVAHLNQMAYAEHDFGAPTAVVVHSDVRSWFSETHGCDAPPEWDAYTGWVRRGIHAADVVVAPSAYQSELIHRHYGRGADRVIHNGAHPPALPPPPRSAPLVLAVGRAWDEAKGMAELDAAAARLERSAPPVHLLGEMTGPHGQRFEPRHLLAHGRVPRDEVDAWMRRAALLVGASRYEPFGLAPLEGALHGCALLLSDIPSFRELWTGCALFFPRGDADALAARLRELAPDRERCAELARAARARALRDYSAERLVERYLALYADMEAGRAEPPLAAAPDG